MRLGVSGRLYLLIGLFTLGCAVLTAALVWMQDRHAMAARERELEAVVDMGIGVLDGHRKLVESGAMSREDAQKRALAILSSSRYHNGDYLIAYAFGPDMVLIMTGSGRNELVGRSQIAQKDANGFEFTRVVARDLEANGKSLIHFMWRRPGSEVPIGKTNFAKLYRPWNIAVATGVFDDDLGAELRSTVLQAAGLAAALALLLAGAAVVIARSISRPLGKLRTAMLALAENRPLTEEIDTARTDEIGEMARAVAVFRESAAQRVSLEQAAQAEQAQRSERQARVDKLIASFRSTIGQVLSAVNASMGRLDTTAKTLSGVAAQATSKATAVSEASGRTST